MAGDNSRHPWEQPGTGRLDCDPHRAHLLLRLGSIGFLLGLLSPLAVPAVLAVGLGAAVNALGKRDLARMAAGRMDSAGAADTRRVMWRTPSPGEPPRLLPVTCPTEGR